jgi:hypothetical protein
MKRAGHFKDKFNEFHTVLKEGIYRNEEEEEEE